MKKIVSLLVVLFAILHHISAQKEITYVNPPAVTGDGYSILLDDIVSNESLCKLRLTVQNPKSDVYLVYYLQKSGFEFENMGKYYEKKEKAVVIDPNTKDASVVKVTDNDFRHRTFTFHPEGLYGANTNTPALQLANLPLKPGSTDKIVKEGVEITLSEVADKKGVVSVSLEIGLSASANNFLLLIDPNKVTVETEKGQVIESDFKNNKTKAILAGDSKKIKFSYTTTEPVHINWHDALKVMPLVPISVPSVKIIDQVPVAAQPVQPAPVAAPAATPAVAPVATPVPQCDAFTAQKNGSMKVVIQAEAGLCFKLSINGFPVVTNFASAAMVYADPGRLKMVFTFQDGTVLEENTITNDWYSSIGYNVIKKKNGSIAARYDPFAQVLSEKGEQNRNEMMSRAQGNASAQGSGCYGDASSGATSIKLKITWKGNPVAYHGIRIRQNGRIIATGSTDQWGMVKLYTNDLYGRDIEVEGCSGNYSWSVSGSYCVLDSFNSLDLNLEEIAKHVGSLLGKTTEEVGAGWGF